MAKYLLVSLLAATIAIPILFARERKPRRGLRKVIWVMTGFVLAWVGFCVYLFIKMGGGY
jgi:hypothetical protein